MLMEQFEKWMMAKEMFGNEVDKDIFSMFYQEQTACKTFFEMIYELAYQMYEMQVCIEGLLEDQDGQENQKA